MNKQEFLAMSLPHELRCEISNKKVCYKLASYTATDYALEFNDKGIIGTPILHPLSDLTKEIEHKGEKFVPLNRLLNAEIGDVTFKTIKGRISFMDRIEVHAEDVHIESIHTDHLETQPFFRVAKLIEWHFDIADLISKGEAIDVNTLPENPYK